MMALAVTEIGLELKPWNTEEIEEVRSILPARKEKNSQLDGISSIALKILTNWLGWMATDGKTKEWGIATMFRKMVQVHHTLGRN